MNLNQKYVDGSSEFFEGYNSIFTPQEPPSRGAGGAAAPLRAHSPWAGSGVVAPWQARTPMDRTCSSQTLLAPAARRRPGGQLSVRGLWLRCSPSLDLYTAREA